MTCVIQRLYASAQHHLRQPALIAGEQQLDYAGLLARVEAMAAQLQDQVAREHGRAIAPTDKIGLSLGKGIDLYVALLAILRTGASYVPIDPALNEDSRQQLRERCRCALVLTPQWLQAHGQADLPAPAPAASIASDIAYTIFTSGSTGRPKGVSVTHLSLLNLVDWAIAAFDLGPGARVLQYSTINFDASVLDIFPTLLSGAALCIASDQERMSEAALAAFCARHGVTQAFLPPPLLTIFDPARFPSLATVLTGGEACHPRAIEAWSQGRRLYNLYGPTEATVLVSCKRMDANTAAQNIGQAIGGVRLHVLDEQQRPAEQGELHIAGLALAAGYLDDPASSAERFISLPALDASRLYRSGDLVQRGADGEIHFLGRLDRQVKVRGYRIELEEIEAALQRLGYQEVAVTADPQAGLVAYIVAPAPLSSQQLRDQLGQHLPDYKVPQQVVRLAAMPYKPNGKVDLGQLPAQVPAAQAQACSEDHGDTFARLAELWANELQVPLASLGPASDFRALGGSSINIMHLLSAVETEFGELVDFIDFLETPTLAFLTHTLEAGASHHA